AAIAGQIAPLIVSRGTGGSAALARAGNSAHSASKALSQRKIRPQYTVQGATSDAPSVVYTPQGPTLWTSVRDRSTFSRRGSFSNGETMSRNSLVSLLSAALLCCGLPVWGQKSSGDKGKELVDAHCNSCHALTARVGSGYDAKGWHTV